MQTLNKSRFAAGTMNFFNYFNVARGYGYQSRRSFPVDKYADKYKYISTEANNPRLAPTYTGPERINRYIVRVPTHDQENMDTDTIRRRTVVVGHFHTGFVS